MAAPFFHQRLPVLGADGRIFAGPVVLAGAPISNFMEYYADASWDKYNKKYDAVMAAAPYTHIKRPTNREGKSCMSSGAA